MSKQKKSIIKSILSMKESGAAIPLVILAIVVACINRNFFGIFNLMDILRTASFYLMVAVPVTFLMSAGGMDLSLGAATSLGGVVCGTLLKAGVSIPVAILLALLTGIVVGLINGVCIVRFALPPFILTLGTQYCVNGIINVWTNGLSTTNFPNAYVKLGQYRVGGIIPMPIIYALVIALIGYVLLQHTKFGRKVLAIGGNQETARLAGINVIGVRISTYVCVSAMAALAGVIYGARFATVQPAIGTGTEMTIMASVIVGGTSMAGGVGTIIGTSIGCVLLAMITNVLIMLGVSAYWQSFVFGLILILSLFIDRYRQRLLKA
ncbi:MAG: ABC transporter permease [Clostridia bacterium]|nr:ABC transporter permease [Clostridia bacterium]